MSLLKLIAGGFFYIVPDEQLLKNYKPLFKKYSYFNMFIVSALLLSVAIIMMLAFSPSILKSILIIIKSNVFKKVIIPKIKWLVIIDIGLITPIIENFIIMKILVSVKYNINKLIVILAFLAALIHYLCGHGLASLWSGFMFYIFIDVFLGGFKQGKNGFLLSVVCHSFYNFLLILPIEILQTVTNLPLIPN